MNSAAADLLQSWLERQLPEPARQWFDQQLNGLAGDGTDRTMHIALGMAPRKLGRDDIALDEADRAAALKARDGWDPRGWSIADGARVLFLCRGGGTGDAFAARFSDLCRSADVAEAVALYRGLPLYPAPELLEAQAAEGVRTNMRAVFEAVAHRSPYPREQFDENRWNQMVLKALFIGSTLHPMQGLDARANPELARILCDYAHERWAAGRAVTPELWRCVGPFADAAALGDLQRVIDGGDERERRGAALALAACRDPAAAPLREAVADLMAEVDDGRLTWDGLMAAETPA